MMFYIKIGTFSFLLWCSNYTPAPPEGGYTVLPLSILPSVRPSFRPSQDIFRHIFLSNYWWQKFDIWSQASYRYAILWEAFLDPSDSYFLFADLVGFYTHWTYMRGYHKWALAHSSSCLYYFIKFITVTRHKAPHRSLCWILIFFLPNVTCGQFPMHYFLAKKILINASNWSRILKLYIKY